MPQVLHALLDTKELDLHVPALVVAELVDIGLKRRTTIELAAMLNVLNRDARFVIHDYTAEMALKSARLGQLPDIHDRCIVATTASLLEEGKDVALVTPDRVIRESKLVPTLWD
jgi:hypothetical protein